MIKKEKITKKSLKLLNNSLNIKIKGDPLPNIPWEERPKDCSNIVWRSEKNPIIPRDLIPTSNSIFNSAAVPYKGKFAGVFRADTKSREKVKSCS